MLVPTTPPTSFSLPLAVGSLERIKEVRPTKLLTPHYGVMDEATNLIDDNIQALNDWNAKICNMLEHGTVQEEIVRILTNETAGRVGQSPSEMPDYLSVSIRVSVQGFIRYLKAVNGG